MRDPHRRLPLPPISTPTGNSTSNGTNNVTSIPQGHLAARSQVATPKSIRSGRQSSPGSAPVRSGAFKPRPQRVVTSRQRVLEAGTRECELSIGRYHPCTSTPRRRSAHNLMADCRSQTTSTDTRSGVSWSAAVQQARPSACKGCDPTRAATISPESHGDRFRPVATVGVRGCARLSRAGSASDDCKGDNAALSFVAGETIEIVPRR